MKKILRKHPKRIKRLKNYNPTEPESEVWRKNTLDKRFILEARIQKFIEEKQLPRV